MHRYVHADGYSEAIPADELAELARTVARACAAHEEQEVRRCAERVVRERLCPCAESVPSLVNAVVTEFRRQGGLAR